MLVLYLINNISKITNKMHSLNMQYSNFIIIYSSNSDQIYQNHEVCKLFCMQKFQKYSIFIAKPC